MVEQINVACAITGDTLPDSHCVPLDALHPSIAARIRDDHPELLPEARVSHAAIANYRNQIIEELLRSEHGELTELDQRVARSIAEQNTLSEIPDEAFDDQRSFGERMADSLARVGGSWRFIIGFMLLLSLWILLNSLFVGPAPPDPYPFILLNLILSCLAALQAPVIMMSQRRQEAKDRLRSENDYKINLKAELEIRHLHEKLDYFIIRSWQRQKEIEQLLTQPPEESA
jgi:uncharacterized membrane protein